MGDLVAFFQERGAKRLRSGDGCTSRPEKFAINALPGTGEAKKRATSVELPPVSREGTKTRTSWKFEEASLRVDFAQLVHQVFQFSLRGVVLGRKCHELPS